MTIKAPGSREVHVWIVSLGHIERERLKVYVDEQETRKAEGYRREVDARHYIAAHGALRLILASYLGIAPESIRYGHGPRGKPMLAPGTPGGRLQFNLSHSGELAAIAVADDREVGVDVEQVREDIHITGLVARVLSPYEREELCKSPSSALSFFRLWARKEAYLKATGEGLRMPLHDVPPLGLQKGRHDDGRWSIIDIEPAPGYAGALAFQGDAGVSVFRWP